MDIREACEDIMGERLASSIISDMGIHWCVVAAMSDPRNSDKPRANGVIRAWLAEQKVAKSSHDDAKCCPVCGGDCGSANPPVIFCPMRDDVKQPRPTREAPHE